MYGGNSCILQVMSADLPFSAATSDDRRRTALPGVLGLVGLVGLGRVAGHVSLQPSKRVYHSNVCTVAPASLYAAVVKQVKPERGPATALPPVVQDALSGVSDALSVEAVLASRALLAVVARSMAAALEEVTLPQFRILVLLSAHGPLRTGTLAEQAGVHPSTLSRTSDRLVKGRWIRRIANPDSRREVLLELTSKGARLVADVTTRRAQELDAILVRVPTRQRRRVFEGFAAFSSAAGEDTGGDLLLLGLPPMAQASRNSP